LVAGLPTKSPKEQILDTIEPMASDIASYIDEYSTHYRTDELFILFGDDFAYTRAQENFVKLDTLIEYMNNRTFRDANATFSKKY